MSGKVHSAKQKLISHPSEKNLPSVSVTVKMNSDRSDQLSVNACCAPFVFHTDTNLTGDLSSS